MFIFRWWNRQIWMVITIFHYLIVFGWISFLLYIAIGNFWYLSGIVFRNLILWNSECWGILLWIGWMIIFWWFIVIRVPFLFFCVLNKLRWNLYIAIKMKDVPVDSIPFCVAKYSSFLLQEHLVGTCNAYTVCTPKILTENHLRIIFRSRYVTPHCVQSLCHY